MSGRGRIPDGLRPGTALPSNPRARELFVQWGDLGPSEAVAPWGQLRPRRQRPSPSGSNVSVAALCDPTADVPFASLSDLTRCLRPVFTAVVRTDPMGSVVVGAASLIAAAGYITPRAGDSHPALLARHVLGMLKLTRSSFPVCLRMNSFPELLGGGGDSRPVRRRDPCRARPVAEQRCPRAIAAKAPTLNALLRSLPQPASPASVYEAYRQLVVLYFQTDRRSMDLLLSDLMFSCSRANPPTSTR